MTSGHLSISLSAQVHARALETVGISESCQHHLARDSRIEACVHQLTRPHLDVEAISSSTS